MSLFDRELPHDARKALFGGTETVRVWNLLQAPAIAPFQVVLACELEPGGRVGPHQQQQFPEIVVGLEGEGSASVDEQAHSLSAGSVVSLPHGAILAIENHSDSIPLRYLIIKAG